MNEDRAYAISAANLDALERNLNYLANNVDNVEVRVEDVNEKVKKVNKEVATINANIKELINEIRETTIISNAKQSISLLQDEINKKYGHYDKIRRKINGLFQAIEVGTIDKNTIRELKEKALVDTPDYWLSSAFVAICSWLNNNEKEAHSALMDAIKKDDEKTSLLFSLINLKFDRYDSSFLWLKRYLDMQDASHIESKIVPLLDTLTNGILDIKEREYFLNKISTWTNDLNATSNYKNIQVNRWIDFLLYLLNVKDYDEYYYVKNYTNKYDDINRLTTINIAQRNIYTYLNNLINEKEEISLDKQSQINKIINLLINNYESDELDLRKDIAQNKLIVEENGNTTKAKDKFRMSEFAYQKNTDFYSLLSNIVLESDELKPSINTKKLSISLLKDLIINSYNQLNNNNLENISIGIKINNFTSSTIDGSNEKQLLQDLYKHIDTENYLEIESVKLFDLKMLFTSLFGLIFSVVLFIMQHLFLGVCVLLVTIAIILYSLFTNYKVKKSKIEKREERKKEEKTILLNTLAEIVDFRFIYKDGLLMKNKIITLLKSLDYTNYIKNTDSRNINIESQTKEFSFDNNKQTNKTDLFEERITKTNKINPPDWDLIPPYEKGV